MSASSKEAVERELAGANGAGSSLVGQLGKTDPQRLMRYIHVHVHECVHACVHVV